MHESAHYILLVQFGEEVRVLHIFLELLSFLRRQPLWPSYWLLNSPSRLAGRINVRNIVCSPDFQNVVFTVWLTRLCIGFYRLDGIIEFHALSTDLKKIGRLKRSLFLSGLLRLLTRMVSLLLFNGHVQIP